MGTRCGCCLCSTVSYGERFEVEIADFVCLAATVLFCFEFVAFGSKILRGEDVKM
jgi:hypothetical protein